MTLIAEHQPTSEFIQKIIILFLQYQVLETKKKVFNRKTRVKKPFTQINHSVRGSETTDFFRWK